MARRVISIALLVSVAFVLGHAWARQDPGQMMAPEWTKLTDEHRQMRDSTGTWEVATSMWMAPGAPPMEFMATAEREMILDGRFLREKFVCDFMGQPFEGQLIQGFDTLSKEFVAIWIDNMSPYLHTSRGRMVDGKLVTRGKSPDMVTGELHDSKSVTEIISDDEVRMSAYNIAADGTETPSMKFVYRRKK